ncbi:MAG TPA: cell division protein ZapA [Bauldia sp.]|nr:cell division protein ZapA [Bauldia sp.]
MGQVNVTISGKTYRMACEDGEEDHLVALAARLNASIEQLRARFGEIGDQRLTVMAAITLADQSAEAERRLAELRAEVASLEQINTELVEQREAGALEMTSALDEVSARLEAVAAAIAGEDAGG